MKTARYTVYKGSTETEEIEVEYDENAPCQVCEEPVMEASVGGTSICPWCDRGICRYCRVDMMVLKEEIDRGRSLKGWRDHMKWHREHPVNG